MNTAQTMEAMCYRCNTRATYRRITEHEVSGFRCQCGCHD